MGILEPRIELVQGLPRVYRLLRCWGGFEEGLQWAYGKLTLDSLHLFSNFMSAVNNFSEPSARQTEAQKSFLYCLEEFGFSVT